MLETIKVYKSYLNKFFDADLIVKEECYDSTVKTRQKTFQVHRLLMVQQSKFFEKYFEKEKGVWNGSRIEYRLVVPFSIETMCFLISVIYGDMKSNDFRVSDCCEIIMGLQYFQFPEIFVEHFVSALVVDLEFYILLDGVDKKQDHFYHLKELFETKQIFDTSKTRMILQRIKTAETPVITGLLTHTDCIFLPEIYQTENRVVITDYAFQATRDKFCNTPIFFRGMVFETVLDTSLFTSSLDDTFLGITSRFENEKNDFTLDKNLEIHENRKSGKEKIHVAKGTLIFFNGYQEPRTFKIVNDIKEEELEFPPDGSYTWKRKTYGICIKDSEINPMSKFKIILDFV